ncbi:MAG: ABC transporter ATP-binding protein [Planctomycetota bacterium]|jgi:oligopeptide/dipeptide ABC transporter ATP-binding protein
MKNAGENVLEVEDLKTYFYVDGEVLRAVDGVTFSVGRGQVLALVGESGCGKSVTAYSLLRLIQKPGRIVGGRVLLHTDAGETIDVTALGEKSDVLFRLRGGLVSMIFQEPMTALSPVHTIENQICEAVRLHQDVTKAEARGVALDMLGRAGIPAPQTRLRMYPHEMSGGMRQRVVIAMALACRPQLLIADEPTTALDVTIQAQVLRLIKDLQSGFGTSVLYITHDLGVVAQIADAVAVMYLGRIVERGGVAEVLKRPRHPYTRSLLKSLPGIRETRGRLESIKGSVPSLREIPPGCPFHPRCPHYAAGQCDVGSPPPLRRLPDGHHVACLRAEEIQ